MGLEQLKARRALRAVPVEALDSAMASHAVPSSSMDKTIGPPAWRPMRFLGFAGLALAVGIGVYGYLHFGLERRAGADAAALTVSTVHRAVFHDEIPVTGNIQPEKTVYLDVAEGGQVAERLAEEGAVVQAGQPIVKLRNVSLELQVTGQEAALAEQLFQLTSVNLQLQETRLQRDRDLNDIDYQIELLTQQIRRRQPLLGQGFVKRSDVEDLRSDLKRYQHQQATVSAARDLDLKTEGDQEAQLKNAIALTQENLAVSRRTLDDLIVKAPISGQLTTLDADPGAFKNPGQRVGQIDRTDAYKVKGLVDEFYLGRVAAGEAATGEIDGTIYRLHVAKVHPEVKDRQFAVDLTFDGPAPQAVRRGETVQLKIEIGSPKDSLVAANGPFADDSGGQWAMVLTPSGRQAVRRPVVLGRRNLDEVEILSGVSAGERIVTSSYADFKTIDTIDIRNADAISGEQHS